MSKKRLGLGFLPILMFLISLVTANAAAAAPAPVSVHQAATVSAPATHVVKHEANKPSASTAVSHSTNGGGNANDTPPAGWCATGPRDPNPAWVIGPDQNYALPNPGCSSQTQYAITMDGQPVRRSADWNQINAWHGTLPATIYDEWVGGSTPPPGHQAPPPPNGFCDHQFGSNFGWSVGPGEQAWNACSGKLGAWMFQPGGVGDPIGHQRHKSFAKLEAWRHNQNYPAGTYWFDRYFVPSGACHSGSTVDIHLPTGVYPSAPCGAKSIYHMDIRANPYEGSWKQLMYIRRCQYHGYEATARAVKVVHRHHHGCGC